MGYALNIPRSGISEFSLYRHPSDMDVEVILGNNTYKFEDLGELKLWLAQVGVVSSFVERLVDIFWNWRTVTFDLRSQRLTIPKNQGHPVDGSITGDQDYVGVLRRGSNDPFDPLQDRHVEHY